MIKYIYYAAILYLLYLLIKWLFRQGRVYQDKARGGVLDEMVQDPVCKIYIPRKEAFKKTYGGKEILFCSRECADKFEFGKRDK